MVLKSRKVIIEAATGNAKAVNQLWEIWSPKLNIFLKNRSDIPFSAKEDIQQEIMERIFRTLGKYNPFYSPATWIYTLANRTIIDWKRKNLSGIRQYSESQLNEKDSAVFSLASGSFPTPETSAIRNEEKRKVRQFINRQSPENRQILYLYCYEELSGRKIASITGMAPGTIRDKIKSLKKKLEEELT